MQLMTAEIQIMLIRLIFIFVVNPRKYQSCKVSCMKKYFPIICRHKYLFDINVQEAKRWLKGA